MHLVYSSCYFLTFTQSEICLSAEKEQLNRILLGICFSCDIYSIDRLKTFVSIKMEYSSRTLVAIVGCQCNSVLHALLKILIPEEEHQLKRIFLRLLHFLCYFICLIQINIPVLTERHQLKAILVALLHFSQDILLSHSTKHTCST